MICGITLIRSTLTNFDVRTYLNSKIESATLSALRVIPIWPSQNVMPIWRVVRWAWLCIHGHIHVTNGSCGYDFKISKKCPLQWSYQYDLLVMWVWPSSLHEMLTSTVIWRWHFVIFEFTPLWIDMTLGYSLSVSVCIWLLVSGW